MKGRPVTIKIKLRRGDRKQLEAIIRMRNIPALNSKRARVLLLLSEGEGVIRVSEIVGISDEAVRLIRRRYLEFGLERAVNGAKAPGASSPYTEGQRQQIIAIACSAPPPGASHWTCRLLAQEAVSRKIVGAIGREAVRIILQSHELKPWREKNVVCPRTR